MTMVAAVVIPLLKNPESLLTFLDRTVNIAS
jgi:hypothetical protein